MAEQTIPGSNVPPTAGELAVWKELFIFHVGREQPLALKAIERRTGMSQRLVKKAVEGLRVRHNVPVGSARGGQDLPVGYFLCKTLEDRDAAARPYVKQFIQESRVIRAIYGNDRRLKELLGQMRLGLE